VKPEKNLIDLKELEMERKSALEKENAGETTY